ncbi:MAG: hypothetical protein WC520_00470 [Candidatus Paceibacterota bacterium]
MLVLLMIGTVAIGSICVYQSYDSYWRNDFAKKHLRVAQAMTDAKSQNAEISTVIEILQPFPKQGNYNIFNDRDPITDLGNAWQELYELQNYTAQISALDVSSFSYQQGIYNSQEKIAYFEDNLLEAFSWYLEIGKFFWTLWVVIIFGCGWFFLTELGYAAARGYGDDKYKKAMIASLIILVVVSVVFGILYTMPVFYTGPV